MANHPLESVHRSLAELEEQVEMPKCHDLQAFAINGYCLTSQLNLGLRWLELKPSAESTS